MSLGMRLAVIGVALLIGLPVLLLVLRLSLAAALTIAAAAGVLTLGRWWADDLRRSRRR